MQLSDLQGRKRVYIVWSFISLLLIFLMLYFKFKIPYILFWFVFLALLKDIFLDYNIIKIKRPRVYWAEHAPLVLLIFIIGILDLAGIDFFRGYVGTITTFLAGIDFFIDFYKDLTEDSVVYERKST